MPRIQIYLLGTPRIKADGEVVRLTHRKAQALLAYLLLNHGTHSREHLATLLWPDTEPKRAYAYLRNGLWQLNQMGLKDWLSADRETIQLQCDDEMWVDVAHVESCLDACRSHNHTESEVCDLCVPLLSEIVELHTGKFLQGFTLEDSAAFDDWQFFQAERLQDQLAAVLERLVNWYSDQAEYKQAIMLARRWLKLDPLHEPVHRILMQNFAWNAQHSAAMRQYQECTRFLDDEFGVSPSAETIALYENIRDRKLRLPAKTGTEPNLVTPSGAEVTSAKTGASPLPAVSKNLVLKRDTRPTIDLPASARSTGERRVVTALIVRVSGSTRGTEKIDLETWAEVMSEILPLMEGEVFRYDGAVHQYKDDGLSVIFGQPITHEDDAERAVLTALSIQDAIKRYAVNQETELMVRVGISTGEVIATTGGSRQQYSTALGQVVKLAEQLSDTAEVDTVRVSESTYRLVTQHFRWQSLGRFQIKDLHTSLEVYQPLSHIDLPSKGRGIEGLKSPLVGREYEFIILQQAVERLQNGIGGIATVVGEAGIGKSRLVAELKLTVIEAQNDNLDWIEGRCLSYATNITYQLWIDIIRSWLGITTDANPETVRKTLEIQVQEVCPDAFADVYPFISRLLSLPIDTQAADRLRGIDAEGLKFLTFRAVEMMIDGITQQHPLVMLCEDLHWADPTSLALIEHILFLTDRMPLLLICVMRPVTDHKSWQIKELAARDYNHRHADMWLKPLSQNESGILVSHLLDIDNLPADFRDRIVQRADGNPFFLEEILRSLIEDEIIALDGYLDSSTGGNSNHWYLIHEIDNLPIPATLQGVLTTRIDRLPQESRQILQIASVMGRSFTSIVLDAVATERGVKDVETHLVVLQRAALIRESTRLPERKFMFKHVLTQEAAYNSLLRRGKRNIHRQVAENLERIYPDHIEEQLGLLAHHWENAGDTVKAVNYLQRAAEYAAAQFANEEALTLLTRALALIPDKDQSENSEHLLQRYSLLIIREGLYNLRGDREVQLQDLNHLSVLANVLNDNSKEGIRRLTEITLRESKYAGVSGDFQKACDLAQKVIDTAQQWGNLDYQAAGYLQLGAIRNKDPIPPLEKALNLARSAQNQELEAACLHMLGITLYNFGEVDTAEQYIKQALTMWRVLDNHLEEGRLLTNLGRIALNQSDHVLVQKMMEQSLRISQETGNRSGVGWAYITLFYNAHELGNYIQAKEYCEHALDVFREIGQWVGQGTALSQLGNTYFCLGDLPKAISILEKLKDSHKDVTLSGYVLGTLGYISWELGEYELACDYTRQAIKVFSFFDRPAVASPLALLGHALASLGKLTEAEEVLRQAVEIRGKKPGGNTRKQVNQVSGLARVALYQGYSEKALTYVEDIMNRMEEYYLVHDPRLFCDYLICVDVLRANDDPRADDLLQTAYDKLQSQAARIDDDVLRRSFLENVPSHRRVVEAWEHAQEGGAPCGL